LTDAEAVMQRCDELATCSEEPGRITRPFASGAMRRVHELGGVWMRAAGMSVRRDNIGNLRARYDGREAGAPTLILGSHLDSVRDAGKYDGPLGVMVAISAVQRLHDADQRLPFAIEVVGFADEEGLRYGSTYLGSRALAGTFDMADLERTDAGGTSMAIAIRSFGGDPSRIPDDRWHEGELLGYCEVHIEQGPVLEGRGVPVGIVSAIAGQNRLRITFTGEAGHAGTVPMDRRHDALVVAAMFVIAVENEARIHEGSVATVGQLEVQPGAANVVPGRVDLSVDVRHADDATRLEACQRIISGAHALADGRGVAVEVRPVSENAAVRCSPRLASLLTSAVEQSGLAGLQMTSGAGHDGVAMSALTEIGMLFVRCGGGVSHNPAESVTAEDVAVAIDVTSGFLELMARTT
jgi:hydantoinase/carbamoylase family amidase